MGSERLFQSILLFGATLSVLATALFIKQGNIPLTTNSSLIAQNVNEYLGPNKKIPGNPKLIRVQILINNDPSPQGVQIESVSFNNQNITLKPRDIYGFRGQASFQTPPGKYKLKWKVRRDKYIWPRTLSHEEEVILDPKDLWIQITIIGDNASIS
ncbi:MAG: hypothetical protein COT85_01630 [Chlamydiae bacterium CG10_big_fil_rev_8_21_14_0_10_42_34]|nr:MAG: hypothetical protein COT85_01630 [Chlamydiae bacterium CG10_big_fil_rev_8_21_14_0_10_42_34]